MKKQLNALLIMDGFGIAENINRNAIKEAGTPNLDALCERFPHTTIGASGLDVGLPNGQMGNSEVGHLNMGAGRVVYQDLTRISLDIENGDFYQNDALIWAMDGAARSGALHLMGLLSDGGVHSHNTHLYALLQMAKKRGISRVYVHCFLDGRDVPPKSGLDFVRQLEAKMQEIGIGEIATVMGRYWAMDRDNRWERVQRAYDAMVLGKGVEAHNASEAVSNSYAQPKMGTDEFVAPTVITKSGKPVARIEPFDSIIFFNFRPDRAREITYALTQMYFAEFEREKGFFPLRFVAMTQYDALQTNLRVAYQKAPPVNTIGEYISKLGMTQLRIAETEKYAHVTFFFNGGEETLFAGEDRVLIPSPKVATYDLKPEMSANEVTEEALRRIHSGAYDFMVLNFANCDMVGHTGVIPATINAVQTVDRCVGRLVSAILAEGGRCIVTADHGNADQMLDPNGSVPFTAHTTNPVPVILCDLNEATTLRSDGRLADLAPTLLDMAGVPLPQEMTGTSLRVK